MLIALDLPPGQYQNGTEFSGRGRWRGGNLIRWHEGALRPVGGWTQRGSVDVAGVVRSAIAWEANNGDRLLAFAAHDALWTMDSDSNVTDITPAGLTGGRVDATGFTGYGGGLYGAGAYGTPRPDTGDALKATVWTLDTWGQNLVACSPDDGKLWEWTLNTASNAAQITNAPTGNLACMVTEDRFLFALGAGGDPRKVQWSDQGDNTTWTPSATNQAGDQILQTFGTIQCGLRTRGQTLILTDQDAHVANYLGQPFVYGFERVGTSCGVVSRAAAVSIDQGAIWMGRRAFYAFRGGAVEDLPCEVADYVFSDFNDTQRSKVSAVVNSQWREIWWFYPSAGSIECDRYVAYDYGENIWMTGTIDRTAGVDRTLFASPMWFASDGVLYSHETGNAYGGTLPYAETGPVSLGDGERVMKARYLYPDENTLGSVTATFKTRFYPTETAVSYGPYTLSEPTGVRFAGRQVKLRVTGAAETDWRVGTMRLDVTPGGRR